MFEKEQNVSLEITNTKTKTKIKNKQKQTNEQTNKIKERNDVKESHLVSNLISIDKLVQNVCVCVCVCVCVFCLFFLNFEYQTIVSIVVPKHFCRNKPQNGPPNNANKFLSIQTKHENFRSSTLYNIPINTPDLHW